MTHALLLLNLPPDPASAPDLEPSAGTLSFEIERLRMLASERGVPVVHVRTGALPETQVPEAVIELAETVTPRETVDPSDLFQTPFADAFAGGALADSLRDAGVDTVILAGVRMHGEIRATAEGAHAAGLAVWIARDAVGSTDPQHDEHARLFLEPDLAWFLDHESLEARLSAVEAGDPPPFGPQLLSPVEPRCRESVIATVECSGPREVDRSVRLAQAAAAAWPHTTMPTRVRLVGELARQLRVESEPLARQLARESGQPVVQARSTMRSALELLEAAARRAETMEPQFGGSGPGWRTRALPHGVVAVLTPAWDPLMSPLGKIAPALLYGNTVVWNPMPAGTPIARRLLALLDESGFPPDTVVLVPGDSVTRSLLLAHPGVQAATITGSSRLGHSAQVLCGRRRIPVQADLGGANVAILWEDADLAVAANEIARSSMCFAGARTALIGRVILPAARAPDFTAALHQAVGDLRWGDPLEETTEIGPLLSDSDADLVRAILADARKEGATIIAPHHAAQHENLARMGSYHAPTIVLGDRPGAGWLREQLPGPVLIVQIATDWPQALALCRDTRRLRSVTLFSRARDRHRSFLDSVRAPVLSISPSSTGHRAEAPDPTWGATGLGPPQHGLGDPLFYTRLQTLFCAD